jgi:hypothetical protein
LANKGDLAYTPGNSTATNPGTSYSASTNGICGSDYNGDGSQKWTCTETCLYY